jgi:hypothetical protein
MKKIEGHPNLVRANSGAIINQDNGSLKRAKARLAGQKQKDDEISDLRTRLENLEKLIAGNLNGIPND